MRFLLFLSTTVVAVVGCASTRQPIAYKPTSASPQVIELVFGSAFYRQTRFAADGVHACYEVYEPRRRSDGSYGYPLGRQVQALPASDRWASFWRTVERLRVAEWRADYSSQDLGTTVYDGTQWWVALSDFRGALESKGGNAYPMLGQPNRTTLDEGASHELTNAFEQLLDNHDAQLVSSSG